MKLDESPRLRAWYFVWAFGLVSLLADMVYEGARSIIGPYLSSLGASATLVSVAAGAGEFIGYGLRVASARLVSRTRRYWTWTMVGYGLTVLSVPLLGVAGGLAGTLTLYAGERLGKAVRAPAKDTLLSFAASATGRGKAFGIHQFLDQLGAVAGPLLLGAILAWRPEDYRLAFASLAIPGIAAMVVLFLLRARVPHPEAYEPATVGPKSVVIESAPAARLPRRFWTYALALAALSAGLASFPLIAFHAQTRALISEPAIPVLFAAAMLVDGIAGLTIGHVYDRFGTRLLLLVPLAGCGTAAALGGSETLLWIGVLLWGATQGVLDSTAKAAVTTLVAAAQRPLAFGWLALLRGLGMLIAGAAIGVAYEHGTAAVAAWIAGANALACIGLSHALKAPRDERPSV